MSKSQKPVVVNVFVWLGFGYNLLASLNLLEANSTTPPTSLHGEFLHTPSPPGQT